MRLLITKRFYCCLLVFASFSAGAQPKFTAAISPSVAGKDEYISLKLTVANSDDIQNIQPPDLSSFTILSGPNRETEMSSMNGVTKQSISVSFVLLPKKTGTINLGNSSAIIEGKTYKSNTLTVTVTNKRSSGNQPNNNLSSIMQMPLSGFDDFDQPQAKEQYDDYILRKGETVPAKVAKNMLLRLQTDKTGCYVGEPVLATYKLYTRLKSESSLSKNPSFNGFSVIDMTQNDLNNYSTESLNGRGYNVYTIRKAQLYPLQAGPIALETATLDNKIDFLKAGTGGGSVISENVSLSSKPVTINVKPLPEDGKPVNFKGAVGNFNIQTTLEKNSFSTNEAGKLLITITGKGNMQLVTAPAVDWPAEFETFDAKSTDNTDNNTVPISGSKTFEIPFSVEKAGDYSIPAVGFSFFDPAAEKYKTLNAPAISFHVSAGAGKKPASPFIKEAKQPVSILAGISRANRMMIFFAAMLLIGGIIFWMNRKKKEGVDIEKNETREDAPEQMFSSLLPDHNPLMQTEDCLHREECVEFYSLLNGEMKAFLAEKFSLIKDTFTVKMLASAMDRAGVENNIVLQTQKLMQDIEWQLYTPFERNEKLHEMYASAQTIIQSLQDRPV